MMKIIPAKLTNNVKYFKLLIAFSFGMLLHVSLIAQTWRLIEPKYPTIDDVVIAFSVADFGITGDGVTDVTQGFQNLLNQLGNQGGGVLFVPEGKYAIRGNLLIPKGITLRGEWKKPVKGEPIVGTILMAYSGKGNENSTPFITMETSAAVMDLSIWYPEQSPASITPYPPSILFGKPNYFGNEFCNAKNITLVNSYSGVIFSRENGGTCPVINGIYGTPLSRGIEIDNIVDVGRIEWIDFSPDYWAGSGLANSPSKGGAHEAWIYENGTGIVMRRNDWSYTCFVNIEGYSKGFHAVESITSPGAQPNGHNYSMTFIRCKTGVDISSANSVGLMFSRINTIDCETAIGVEPNTSGVVQLHTCNLGATKNAIQIDPSASIRLMLLQSAVLKGAVNIEGGTFTATDCDFNNETPQIALKKNSRGIITGNRFAKSVLIENKSIFQSIIDHSAVNMKKLPVLPDIMPETHKPSRMVMYMANDAPFNAKNDGVTDNTDAIQNALNQASTDGGGIVFLPPGKYKVLGNLVIPSGVELKGSVDLSTTPTGTGSVLEVYAGKNDPNGTPFLKLSAGSGIRGIVFDYPEQISTMLPNIATYPYCIQANGSDTYMVNIGMRAVYHGIDLFTYKCDNHYVDFVAGHAFNNGIKVGSGSVGGKIYNTQFNVIAYACGNESKFGEWPNSPAAGNAKAYEYGFDHFDFLILGNCQDELLYNDFHYGSQNGIILTDEEGVGPSGNSVGYGIDGSRNAMVIEGLGSGGFDFINSQIVAIGDQNTKYIQTDSGFTSEMNLFNADFWGNPTQGITLGGGNLNLQSANFNQPGQTVLATINSGNLKIESSAVWPVNKLIRSGTEPNFSVHSSIIDPSGIEKSYCALWNNNMSNSPSVSVSSAISRSGWAVSASQNTGSARSAIDGLSSTRWDTQGSQQSGQWFAVNFGKQLKIEALLLDVAASPGDSPQAWEMYVSENGSTWYGPAIAGKGTDVMTIVSFPTTTVQYVRIKQTGSKGNYWSIHELNVFGDQNAVSVTNVSFDSDEIAVAKDSVKQLTANILPENAENRKLFWLSGNSTIAKVDANGLLTAVGYGNTTVTAVTMDGIKKATIKVVVNQDGTTGLTPASDLAEFSFELYPNPASSLVKYTHHLPQASISTVAVYNIQGVLQKSETVKSGSGMYTGQLDLNGLIPGCYFVRLNSENKTVTRQLIVK